jgi:hypothetical protein
VRLRLLPPSSYEFGYTNADAGVWQPWRRLHLEHINLYLTKPPDELLILNNALDKLAQGKPCALMSHLHAETGH